MENNRIVEWGQQCLAFAVMANVELWNTYHKKQDVLIERFGSKEKAMEETLFVLFHGTKKAIPFVEKH